MNYCAQCGKDLVPEARFCSACGTRNAAYPMTAVPAQTRLIRPRQGRMIAGVCQGLALSYGWDVVWVRIITVLIAFFSSGAGGLAYIVFWIVMPEEQYALFAPPLVSGASAAESAAAPFPNPPDAWK